MGCYTFGIDLDPVTVVVKLDLDAYYNKKEAPSCSSKLASPDRKIDGQTDRLNLLPTAYAVGNNPD